MALKDVILKSALSVGLVAMFQLCPHVAQAQGQPTVSLVQLQVQPGNRGQQLVLTPKGYLVPLPGGGVNGNVIDIYMGSSGGFWYVDRSGQTIDLTSAVAQFRAQTGQIQQAAPPQYAPYPQYSNQYPNQNPNQTTVINNTGGSQSGGSPYATAAAAGLGAMVGSAATTALYNSNVPYGSPMYYGANGNPYYNGDINPQNVAAAKGMQDYHQNQQLQQAAQYSQANQQNRQATSTANQQQRQASAQQYSAQQNQNFQKQQQWYQAQSQNKGQMESWRQQTPTENPFTRGGAQGEAGRFGQAQGEGGGRFGQGQGESGGRVGQGQGESGGRVGQGEGERGAAQGDGGRFGSAREGEGGGRFGSREGGGRFRRGR